MTNKEKFALCQKVSEALSPPKIDLRTILKTLGLAKTCFYRRKNQPALTQKDLDDLQWRYRIERVLLKHPRYGQRRTSAQLNRHGYRVNKKKIQRLMKKLGLTCKVKTIFRIPGDLDKTHPNLIQGLNIVKPNYVWALDSGLNLDTDQ